MDRFVDSLDREIRAFDRPEVDTVFIGGGTPTHLPESTLGRLLRIVQERFVMSKNVEFSVEANPEDMTEEKLEILAIHGVNRVSLGVQSFSEEKLLILQRGHRGPQAAEVVHRVAEQIENVAIDLIFATPEETLARWESDLHHAIELPIKHLSTYSLTYEKGTPFWKRMRLGELRSLDDGEEIDQYHASQRIAGAAGFDHYEISNFAKPGFRCRHNMAYWDGKGWLAAGPGAARFVDGRREVNHRSPTTYIKKMEAGLPPVAESEAIGWDQYARERFAFGMRMIEGVNVETLRHETGIDLQQRCTEALENMVDRGWVTIENHHVRMTREGFLFADSIAAEILSS